MKKILIVDDHPSVGEGTKLMLEQDKDIHISIANSGKVAFNLSQMNEYDLFIIDLHMNDMNGLELTKKLISLNPNSCILIYSGYDISPHFNLLVEAGVSGFVSKTATREELLNSIRFAFRDETLIPVSLFKQLRRLALINPTYCAENGSNTNTTLTTREEQILHEIVQGRNNKTIASNYHLSQRSIEYTISDIFKKLGVTTRVEAVNKARDMGITINNLL